MDNNLGLHHLHKRKRIFQKQKKYSSPNKLERLMDKLIYIVAIFGPLIALPQLFEIWINKKVEGVSIITWGGFLIGSLFWVSYGLIHKEKPIIIMNMIWFILYILIIAGVFVYR